MRGLIAKDLCLTVKRKRTLIIFAVMAVVMGIAIDGSFIVGYLTMLSAIVAIGTISFDELDNGYAFLMTLPVDRKTYVLEKYLFCAGMSVAGWVISLGIYYAGSLIRNVPVNLLAELPSLFAILPVMFILPSVMIPLQLKYGAEKSRTTLFIIYGGLALLIFAAVKLMDLSGINYLEAFSMIESVPSALILGGLLLVFASVLIMSFLISVRVMKKKEF